MSTPSVAGLLAAFAIAFAGCGSAADRSPSLPASSTAPRLDGRIEPAEWRGARPLSLGSHGRALVLRRDMTLFVAIDGGAKGIASLLVLRGDRMYVLHASAALGTGIYRRDADGSWVREQDFTF